MLTARAGERILSVKSDRQTDFGLLMDQIAMAGAMHGDFSGFHGRTLQVIHQPLRNATPIRLAATAYCQNLPLTKPRLVYLTAFWDVWEMFCSIMAGQASPCRPATACQVKYGACYLHVNQLNLV